MTTKVEKSVVVDMGLSTVYNQWTQFEDFPHFMGGVERVTQLADDRLEWLAEMGGVQRQWIARILEQVPDRKVAWAAVEGATNAGTVTFTELSPGRTEVHLAMEFEPEGPVETVGDLLHVVGNQAERDLDNFKRFIEDEGYASGAWRGSINRGADVTPNLDDAAASRGDSGKLPGTSPIGNRPEPTDDGELDLVDEPGTPGTGPAGSGLLGADPGLRLPRAGADVDPDQAADVIRRDDDFGGGTARLS